MNTSKFTRRGLPVLLAAVALGGCEIKNPLDGVEIHFNVADVPVELNSPAMAIVPGQVTKTPVNVAFTSTISSVNSISEIKLQPSFFTFTPAAGMSAIVDGSAPTGANSGMVTIALLNQGNPLFVVTVTVTNNVVTAVSPGTATPQEMAADIRARAAVLAARYPQEAAQFSSWQNMTADQLVSSINTLLSQRNSTLQIVVMGDSGLRGNIRLSQFSLSGQVAQGL